MKKITAIVTACLLGWIAMAADLSSSSVFQLRLVLDSPTSDSEQVTLSNKVGTAEILNLQKAILLDQTALKSANVQADKLGQPQIAITFTDDGAKRFAEITRESIGKRVAIIIAGRPCSAPVIRTEIPNGKAVIAGSFSKEEAKELAKKINDAAEKK
jgi:preprotein translocase subunit SecD